MRFRAVRLRTLGRFSAGDPWQGQRPTEFSIEEYVMMPQGATTAVNSQYCHRAGLRSETDGAQYMMPESLLELWRRGQIPAERLPVLTQTITPRLTQEDFNLVLHQDLVKSVLVPLAAVFAVVVGIGLFVPIEGHTMSAPAAIATGFGFAVLIGAIQWIVRQSGRTRRAEQMQWLLNANSGAVGAPPEGRTKGRVKMFEQMFAVLLGVSAIGIGGAWWWFEARGKSNEPEVSATTGEIVMPVEMLANQIPEGVSMLVMVPTTGEQVTVRIPPRTPEGTRLHLAGKGSPSPKGGRGDLYLKVHIHY